MRRLNPSQIAYRLQQQYGEGAAEFAKLQAEQRFRRGDAEGYSDWRHVITLIDTMQIAEPNASGHGSS